MSLQEPTRQRVLKALGEAPATARQSKRAPKPEVAPDYETGPIPEGMSPVLWAAANFDLLSRMARTAGETLLDDYHRRRSITPDDVQAGIETLAEEQERQAEQERQRSGKSA